MKPITVTPTTPTHEPYRQLLQAKRAELIRRRHATEHIAVERVPDEMDQLVLASQRELAIEAIHRDAVLLRQIAEALDRVAAGDYGICMHCEEPIAPRRLNAVPWAALCIRCQEAADQDGIGEPHGAHPDAFLPDAA